MGLFIDFSQDFMQAFNINLLKKNHMKFMKILSFAIMYIVSFGLSAQEINESSIVKKWKIDLELMQDVVSQMISEKPEMAKLDEINKSVAIQTAIEKIAHIKMEYKIDGTVISVNSKGTSQGTWKFDKIENVIISKIGNNKEKKFKIISIDAKKMHLKTDQNKDLFFITED